MTVWVCAGAPPAASHPDGPPAPTPPALGCRQDPIDVEPPEVLPAAGREEKQIAVAAAAAVAAAVQPAAAVTASPLPAAVLAAAAEASKILFSLPPSPAPDSGLFWVT